METESKAPGLVSSWHFFQRSEDTGEIRWQRMGVGRKWRLLEKMEGEKAEVGDPYKVVQGRPTPTLTLPPQIVKCHGNPRYRLSFRGGGGGRKTPRSQESSKPANGLYGNAAFLSSRASKWWRPGFKELGENVEPPSLYRILSRAD